MKLLTHIPAWIKNKYFIAIIIFAAIMLFFDKNDVFTQADRKRQLQDLLLSKQYYTEQIAMEQAELEKMKTNPAILEKYAREKYLMKRDNEDLYLVPENYEDPKN
jgi:cell division protein FtsB